MKQPFLLTNILFFFIVIYSCAQQVQEPIENKIEIPRVKANEIVIYHIGYSLLYNEEHEQASWVAYELTKEETVKVFDRTDKFNTDPSVKTCTANNSDYAGSGYDRGHLAPAADMGWSSNAMAESFYYSNISPQEPGFNRGIWQRLEALVRRWAVEYNSLLIVTGPVLKNGLKAIGANQVSVPDVFYKVILDNKEPVIKGIAFLIPNTSQSLSLQSFAISIDSVETITGIDFFPNLPDVQENSIESKVVIEQWTWTSSSTVYTSNVKKVSVSVQCNGVTKTRNRCRNKTLNPSGYCYLHENQIKNQ